MIQLSSLAWILFCHGSFLVVQSLWRTPWILNALEWIAGSSNQEILSKRISLSPNVWPWCICSVIQQQVVNWKSCPRCGIPDQSGAETCLKNRRITDDPRESGGLRAIFSWTSQGPPHRLLWPLFWSVDACITLVIQYFEYHINPKRVNSWRKKKKRQGKWLGEHFKRERFKYQKILAGLRKKLVKPLNIF